MKLSVSLVLSFSLPLLPYFVQRELVSYPSSLGHMKYVSCAVLR